MPSRGIAVSYGSFIPSFLRNLHTLLQTSLIAQLVKDLPAVQETRVWSLGWEDALEKEMAAHSSTLAWKIPWMEEPGRLQSMGSQRVGHDWVISLNFRESSSTATKTQNSQKSINEDFKGYSNRKKEMEWSCPFCINPVNICLNHCFDLGVKTA